MMRRIMIVDDDRELCALLKDYLEPFGFECLMEHNGADAAKRLQDEAGKGIDLVLLDVMLPGKNGFEVLEELRGIPQLAALPIIMLTAQGDDVNRVVGLEMGADDYLPKPFNPRELLARMRAVLRRAAPAAAAPASFDIRLDVGSLRAVVEGRSVSLTGQECRLLELLLETPGKLVQRERLYRELFGRAARSFDRSLDMQVSRLRKKLGPGADGQDRIRSVRGEGYMYVTGQEGE